MNEITKRENTYEKLISNIGELPEKGHRAAFQKVNTILVETYWHIVKQIVKLL